MLHLATRNTFVREEKGYKRICCELPYDIILSLNTNSNYFHTGLKMTSCVPLPHKFKQIVFYIFFKYCQKYTKMVTNCFVKATANSNILCPSISQGLSPLLYLPLVPLQ